MKKWYSVTLIHTHDIEFEDIDAAISGRASELSRDKLCGLSMVFNLIIKVRYSMSHTRTKLRAAEPIGRIINIECLLLHFVSPLVSNPECCLSIQIRPPFFSHFQSNLRFSGIGCMNSTTARSSCSQVSSKLQFSRPKGVALS